MCRLSYGNWKWAVLTVVPCFAGAGGPAPEELIERSATDAAVFLTVYPLQGLQVLTQDDYTALGNQLLNCELCLRFDLAAAIGLLWRKKLNIRLLLCYFRH